MNPQQGFADENDLNQKLFAEIQRIDEIFQTPTPPVTESESETETEVEDDDDDNELKTYQECSLTFNLQSKSNDNQSYYNFNSLLELGETILQECSLQAH